MSYDVIIVGAGRMGSAAAWQLARRGRWVPAIERSDIRTRWARRTGSAASSHVPLLRRAYALWREIVVDEIVAGLATATARLRIAPRRGWAKHLELADARCGSGGQATARDARSRADTALA